MCAFRRVVFSLLMLFCFVPAADFLSVFWWAPHVLAAAHDYFLPIKPCTKTPWQQSKHSLFYSVCTSYGHIPATNTAAKWLSPDWTVQGNYKSLSRWHYLYLLCDNSAARTSRQSFLPCKGQHCHVIWCTLITVTGNTIMPNTFAVYAHWLPAMRACLLL